MPLIYACIAPHAGDLIPETAEEAGKIPATRTSMQHMGRRLQNLEPETIVIVNPHGFRVPNAISIAATERATADWSPEVKLDFRMDLELANAIADRAAGMSVPVERYVYGSSGGPDCFTPLDWGAVVPLYFMGHAFHPKPALVHISPMKLLPYRTHYDFGRALAQAAMQSTRRIALIASADQGHAHNPSGPYGFDPGSARYDAWMQETVRSGRLDELLSAEPGLVEAAKPDSLWPTLVLAGALNENPLRASFLSYEINGYFGVLCAEFVGQEQ